MSALAREALAKELFNAIISDERRAYKRLDLHFMRPDQGVADFMESHRTILRAKAVVPSHACPKSLKVSSIIFAVSDTDWKQVGMKTLLFDLDPSKPVSETTWTSEEIIKTVGHVYNSCDVRRRSTHEVERDWEKLLWWQKAISNLPSSSAK